MKHIHWKHVSCCFRFLFFRHHLNFQYVAGIWYFVRFINVKQYGSRLYYTEDNNCCALLKVTGVPSFPKKKKRSNLFFHLLKVNCLISTSSTICVKWFLSFLWNCVPMYNDDRCQCETACPLVCASIVMTQCPLMELAIYMEDSVMSVWNILLLFCNMHSDDSVTFQSVWYYPGTRKLPLGPSGIFLLELNA